MPTLLINLLIAHVLADFVFQPHGWCKKKEQGKIEYHIYHAAVVFICSWTLSLTWGFWWLAAAIAVVHFGVDFLKYKFTQGRENIWWFVGDQAMHAGVIVVAAYLWGEPDCGYNFPTVLVLAGLLCLKPANVFIQKFFLSEKLNAPKEGNDLPKAGRIIGKLERLLTLALVVAGQWSAVGFVFAAKSILRFKEAETGKTEYLLIGSLLSFGIAIGLGIWCSRLYVL